MSKSGLLQELMPSLWQGSWSPASLKRHLFGDERHSIEELCRMMMASDGEYSSLLISERILNAFRKLDRESRLEFFNLLNDEYDLDTDAVRDAAGRYADNPGIDTLRDLTRLSEPGRQELFRRLNLASGATSRLVSMREALLDLAREHPELGKIDVDFRHLFNSWFNRGFLVMHPIDWTTPAHILEKIIAYEAVHEIGNWTELRNRLEPDDRHCFAFFHPAMEDEPLVFVEVALMEKVPTAINQILGDRDPAVAADRAQCAVFYSISNCHAGLAGVSFGNFLIKQVATSLKQRFPQLKRFVTLSPAPGFRRWLESADDPDTRSLVSEIDRAEGRFENDRDRQKLLRLAARYFLEARTPRERPIDPVARFHLKNGARLEGLNPEADLSGKGLKQSLGLMVNYVYNLSKVEENHENYMQNNKVICSGQVRKYLSG